MIKRIRALSRRWRQRRGSALMLTMVLTIAMGGLALSAIYMAGSSSMLSKLYDRERDYRYAAEWALSIGKARILTDTSLHLPDSLYVQIMNGSTVIDANGTAVPKVKVDLYAGVGGASTGQYGRFVELVAVAYDNGGARHVRRLELQAENFARYAMFVDQFGGGLCYGTGEIIRGRAHSNQGWVSCGSSPGPIYTDTVSAVGTISGTGQFQSAQVPSAAVINFPTVSKLAFLQSYAASANLSYTPVALVGQTGGTRMEFTPVDLDGDGTFTGPAEGYFRIFEAYTGATNNPWTTGQAATPFVTGGTDTTLTRASTPSATRFDNILTGATSLNKSMILYQCGVYYNMGNPLRPQFMPLAAHDTVDKRYKWFIDSLATPARLNGRANALNYLKLYMPSNAASGTNLTALLKSGSAVTTGSGRCFAAGDPNLMPVERPGLLNAFPAAAGQSIDTLPNASKRGGEDSTFTWKTKTGVWKQWTGWTGASSFTGATRRQVVEEPYLWPVHRTQNLNSKGVVYIGGNIYLSGVFRGRVTLYVNGDVKFIDDLTYVTNPASLPICQNLLGIITGQNIWITENDINRPRFMDGTGTANARFLDDNQDFFLHGVTLVGVSNTSATFGVEGLTNGPNAGRQCTPVSPYAANTSGGCINQTGGVIERKISGTFSNSWDGFAENRVKDACLDVDSPPYFPLTGRYLDNEFYEIDPQQFNTIGVTAFYRRLQAGT